MPELSIVIPHYNTPQLLKKLLDTIPVIDNIQVLVIDDNSTVEAEYYDQLHTDYQHITFLTNNTGKNSAGICRNIGLQHAKGHWILFADADDYFIDGFYDIVSEYFDSEYSIVFFTPTSIDIDTGDISNRHIHYERLVKSFVRDSSHKNILSLRYSYLSPCSKLISRECLTSNNILFEDTLVANDVIFSTMLGHHAKEITAVDKKIYTIAMKKSSITTTVNEERIFARLNVLVRQYKFLENHLSKNDFRTLDISGGSHIFVALRNKFPLKTLFSMITFLIKHKVKIFRRRYLNPVYVFRELKAHSRKFEKDYYEYKEG